MMKAPLRRVIKPAGGGAAIRKLPPRGEGGRFVKCEGDDPAMPLDADELIEKVAKPSPNPVDAAILKPTAQPNESPPGGQLVERVTRAIERELSQIEEIVSGKRLTASQRTEAEKCTRTLASLARTLAEVKKLNSAAENQSEHDDVPRDLDEFRRTLARRLAQMVDPPEITPDCGNDAL